MTATGPETPASAGSSASPIERWQHAHDFLGHAHAEHQRRTRTVIALTAAMMVGEIVAGIVSGSMALLADGWHMATHVGALSISALAYAFARRHARDPGFAFGTGKLGDLAGFASAVVLALIALWIGAESCLRLARPVGIAFNEALAVAALGLLVNLVSAFLLGGDDHAHAHDADHRHDASCEVHRDHNLRSAYLHVLADALTSVLAIVGLLAGKLAGWTWLDPLVGVLGAVLIARWSLGLVRDTAAVLLDRVPAGGLTQSIRACLEQDGDRISDLHVWRVGPGHAAAIVALVSHDPRPPAWYRQKLAGVPGLSHVTVEVARDESNGVAGAGEAR